MYMEQGRHLIIKDHDKIYGALYDMLNQHYQEFKVGYEGGQQETKRYCRVALGSVHSRCFVNDSFRCIMLEEWKDVDYSDPPRLNRCEKQLLKYRDMLSDTKQDWLKQLERWVRSTSTLDDQEKAKVSDGSRSASHFPPRVT